MLALAERSHRDSQEDLRKKMQESQRGETGRQGIRSAVLALVVSESYDSAREELEIYVEQQTAFPSFQERVARYVQHCRELIRAIETKRNFPGLTTLSLSKQQEIDERVLQHFDELKHNLRHIERVERDHRLTDLRSTVIALWSLSGTVAFVAAAAFLVDLKSGVLSSLIYTTSITLDNLATWVINFIF